MLFATAPVSCCVWARGKMRFVKNHRARWRLRRYNARKRRVVMATRVVKGHVTIVDWLRIEWDAPTLYRISPDDFGVA